MANALTDNLMLDFNVDLNTITPGTTVFVIFFCFFKTPSSMIIRRIGAIAGSLSPCYSGVSLLLAKSDSKDRASFLICRTLVGTFETGCIPGTAIYLTRYYRREEMAPRMSIFWSTLAIANTAAGVLSFILHIRGISGFAG